MSNTNATLSASIIALQCLQFIRQHFPILTSVATDFSADAAKYNQAVVSRVVTPIAAADYSTSTGYAATATSVADVSVTINKHKHVSVSFNDQEISSTPRNLISEQTEAAAYSLGKQMSDDLWALVTTTNFTATPVNITNEAAAARSTLLTLRQKLVAAGATLNRQGIVSAGTFAALAGDSNIFAKLYTDADIDYEEGVIQNYAGYQRIVEFNGIPAGSTPFVRGLFGGKEGLVIATRVPADPGMMASGVPIPAEIGVVQDADTGMALQYRYMYDAFKGNLQMTLTVMYGVSVGVNAHAIILTSTS
jgi:hypothetical protein